MPAKLYIGLDVGASKTELLACSVAGEKDGRDDLNLHGPGANPRRVGVECAARELAELVHEAQDRRPEAQVTAICAGVAGASNGEDQQELTNRLHDALQLPHAPTVHVVHDAAIALETAFAGKSGIAVIAGTGSVAYARTPAGTLERAGGWGYLLGDEGGGYAIGRDGLRAVTHALDGGPSSCLPTLLAERHGLHTRADLLDRVYHEEWPMQEAAALVLEAADAGDAVASGIIADQTAFLAKQVGWLAARCPSMRSRIALFGGLTKARSYADALRTALAECLPSWSVWREEAPPVTGALQLAKHLNDSPAPSESVAPEQPSHTH